MAGGSGLIRGGRLGAVADDAAELARERAADMGGDGLLALATKLKAKIVDRGALPGSRQLIGSRDRVHGPGHCPRAD